MSFLVLFGLLMGAFLSGSMLIAGVVEEPLRMTEHLNFDYTKPSPDALVPVGSCNGGLCSGGKAGAWERRGWRLVPPNQKLQSTTSLTWPESDYNQKLGVFQACSSLVSFNFRLDFFHKMSKFGAEGSFVIPAFKGRWIFQRLVRLHETRRPLTADKSVFPRVKGFHKAVRRSIALLRDGTRHKSTLSLQKSIVSSC